MYEELAIFAVIGDMVLPCHIHHAQGVPDVMVS